MWWLVCRPDVTFTVDWAINIRSPDCHSKPMIKEVHQQNLLISADCQRVHLWPFSIHAVNQIKSHYFAHLLIDITAIPAQWNALIYERFLTINQPNKKVTISLIYWLILLLLKLGEFKLLSISLPPKAKRFQAPVNVSHLLSVSVESTQAHRTNQRAYCRNRPSTRKKAVLPLHIRSQLESVIMNCYQAESVNTRRTTLSSNPRD